MYAQYTGMFIINNMAQCMPNIIIFKYPTTQRMPNILMYNKSMAQHMTKYSTVAQRKPSIFYM